MLDYNKYENKVEYPERPSKPGLKNDNPEAYIAYAQWLKGGKEEHAAKQRAYHDEDARLVDLFKKDLLAEYGLTNHPKADSIFNYCWQEGHFGGYLCDVESVMSNITDLFIDGVPDKGRQVLEKGLMDILSEIPIFPKLPLVLTIQSIAVKALETAKRGRDVV